MRYETIIDRFIEGGGNSNVKIMGIGGGGCNAVEGLYKRGLENVTYAVCNTDMISLRACDVPTRIAIGEMGAGDIPERGYDAAESHAAEIKRVLSDGTEMLFFAVGMGGGTGTGASPVVARIAKELGILTVGIVTTPFLFEGKAKMSRAQKWISILDGEADALIVINNEKLTGMPGYILPEAFQRADAVLADAVESIVNLVVKRGDVNADLADVRTTLRSGKRAVISTGEGEGEQRVTDALGDAVASILTEDVDLRRCNRVLINLYCSREQAITMREMKALEEFTGQMMEDVAVKFGFNIDEALGGKVKVTVLASIF